MNTISDGLLIYIDNLIERYPSLKTSQESIIQCYRILETCYENGGKLLIAGNGGSAADSEHIVGELMKSFCLPRSLDSYFSNKLIESNEKYGHMLASKLQKSLPAIALSNHNSLNTAMLNDVDGLLCFAQQVVGYGLEDDVFLGISTSGNSKNVLFAAITAKAKNMKVIGLTGCKGGDLADITDACIKVDEKETYKIQELHLPIYHCLCLMLEDHFYKGHLQ